MAKARGWSLQKTVRVTLICGIGHLGGSVLLGFVGIMLGVQLASLEWLESMRGNVAAWLLIGFGLAYLAWGLARLIKTSHTRTGTAMEGSLTSINTAITATMPTYMINKHMTKGSDRGR